MRWFVARWGAGVAVLGLAVLIVGTFLPWLRSGDVLRNSYQSVGAIRSLIDGAPNAVLTAWLFVIPVCALCVALYALRLRRTSAAVGVVVSIVVGTAAVLVAVQGDEPGALVGASAVGPMVTLVGAVVVLLGAAAVLTVPRGGQRTRGDSL